MQITGLKSRIIAQNADLNEEIALSLKNNNFSIKNGDILVISSKVVSFCDGRIVEIPKNDSQSDTPGLTEQKNLSKTFAQLVADEADQIIPGKYPLTITQNIFVAQAGIDESNVPGGSVVLWPEFPYDRADHIRSDLIQKYSLTDLGVVIADSVCTPLRAGTVGVAIGYSGFIGVENKIGEKDLFGRELTVSKLNIADSLATAANMIMGEAAEATPFVIVRDSQVHFSDEPVSRREISIDPENCLFNGLYRF